MQNGRTAILAGVVQRGAIHHLELWVDDLDETSRSLGWLLDELGYRLYQDWPAGHSWRLGATYVVAERSPDLAGGGHDRRRPGLNHMAFHAGTRTEVDHLVRAGAAHGWQLMFTDRHPYAGGPDHYAAYLQDAAGFEVELVATEGDVR